MVLKNIDKICIMKEKGKNGYKCVALNVDRCDWKEPFVCPFRKSFLKYKRRGAEVIKYE